MAEILGDVEHMKKFGCTIEQGLAKLTSWQVGSPIANSFIKPGCDGGFSGRMSSIGFTMPRENR